jgi:hypothetical protein
LKRLRKKKQDQQKIEMLIAKKRQMTREKRKALETDKERDLGLQQMTDATKHLISNETSRDISIRLKDAANRSAAKISNETLQERSITAIAKKFTWHCRY